MARKVQWINIPQCRADKWMQDATRTFYSVLATFGELRNWDDIGGSIRWNKQFRRRAAAVYINTFKPTMVFYLSLNTWPLMNARERKNVTLHEACHAVDYLRFMRSPVPFFRDEHGQRFKVLMAKVGGDTTANRWSATSQARLLTLSCNHPYLKKTRIVKE